MREARAIRGLPLFGIAASGMIAGHWLSYRISVPSAAARQLLLAATGHAHWLLVAKLAASVGLAGVGALFARHLSDRQAARSPSGFEGYAFVLVRLAVIQAAAFAGMEVVERAWVGAPILGLFAHHLFVLGLSVQFLMACAGSFLLLALCRTARRVAETLGAPPRVPAAAGCARIPAEPSAPMARMPAGAFGIRGPPRS